MREIGPCGLFLIPGRLRLSFVFSVVINHGSVIISPGQVDTGAGIIKATGPPLSRGLARLQISVPSPAEMSPGALCLWLVLLLRQGCVTPLAIPQDGRPEEQRGRPEPIMNAASKQETQFHLTDLPRGPAVAPHKKPPQFMLDLFNVVSVSHGTPKSQKEILDGNIVRSFEDKGKKKKQFTDFRYILLLVTTRLIWHRFPITRNYARGANTE